MSKSYLEDEISNVRSWLQDNQDLREDGLLCNECGTAMDDLEELADDDGVIRHVPGHPRICEDCINENDSARATS